MGWYALFVETGKENVVEKILTNHFNQHVSRCFVPKKIVSERKNGVVYDAIKTLFPGYIFIQTNITSKIYYDLISIPKTYYMVNCGKHKNDDYQTYYSEIPEEDMNWILQITNKEGILSYSDVIIQDKQIQVITGPLKGMEALVKKIDKRKGRAKIEIDLLGELKTLYVGINILNK
ncbi:transcription termination factor nusG family protein [Brevibacillus laterosporus GI-9]|uniref:antiterminator LoaP n=1 Tax=Brevibacillus TaxID=55080 RepID=UPI0002405097|nr:antiterminator LoaP [Brevibacillus laterosporus]MCR8966031.1 antiterminator LoaP [Brevibacillus laterosporus]MCZ0838187.1 antiterminator LoaP [Brevibacillus halotolerans]CCF15401.1 transcription termination factor nusG family protein [Brevibacillus laterosporus GI-9]